MTRAMSSSSVLPVTLIVGVGVICPKLPAMITCIILIVALEPLC